MFQPKITEILTDVPISHQLIEISRDFNRQFSILWLVNYPTFDQLLTDFFSKIKNLQNLFSKFVSIFFFRKYTDFFSNIKKYIKNIKNYLYEFGFPKVFSGNAENLQLTFCSKKIKILKNYIFWKKTIQYQKVPKTFFHEKKTS